jgi:hypothetical protein
VFIIIGVLVAIGSILGASCDILNIVGDSGICVKFRGYAKFGDCCSAIFGLFNTSEIGRVTGVPKVS